MGIAAIYLHKYPYAQCKSPEHHTRPDDAGQCFGQIFSAQPVDEEPDQRQQRYQIYYL